MRDAEVDQARFLVAGDDLDRVSEYALGAFQELGAVAGLAHRVGADRHDVRVGQIPQPLAEALEGDERPVDGALREVSLLVEPCREPHRITDPVQDVDPAAVFGASHDHVEAVRAEIHTGNDALRLAHGVINTLNLARGDAY